MTQPPVYMNRNHFDPVPELAVLRTDEQPVSRVQLPMGAEAWLVTSYAGVREVLSDPSRFSNVMPTFLGDAPQADGPDSAGMLLGYDPPEHTRLRRMLTGAFTGRRMELLRPMVEKIVGEQLDALEQAGSPADLVEHFALPVPSLVIGELLGVPADDRADFQRRSKARTNLSITLEERTVLGNESREFMADLVARRRREPTDDLLGMMVREHGDDVTDAELIGVGDLLLIAGHETTAKMLGLGTLLLLRNPDQLARVRDDDAAVEPAIEQLLRYLSVVYAVFPRFAVADTTLAGVPIRAGEVVIGSLLSANRDSDFGADLDKFDIDRRSPGHLAFGHGVHHCLGAPLARLEMRIAYPALS
ncbi:cytochrome P450 [Fodinicola feengrottensis]|uniref:cytochrome P450 n=1 Tax=Fodinicola feengrottensis TaxID=435914 RepID=UPI0036F4274B